MIDETGEAIDARNSLVDWARGELGEQNPDKYYRVCAPEFIGHKHDKSWCGIFCLAGLHAIGVCDWMWQGGKGFVWRLARTTEPQRGDIAVFRKGASGKDLWHHAIVESADEDRVHTIDGNVMPFPKEGVETRVRPIDSNVTFYSIGRLLGTRPDNERPDTEPSGPPSQS